jgi:hypothetical protein
MKDKIEKLEALLAGIEEVFNNHPDTDIAQKELTKINEFNDVTIK